MRMYIYIPKYNQLWFLSSLNIGHKFKIFFIKYIIPPDMPLKLQVGCSKTDRFSLEAGQRGLYLCTDIHYGVASSDLLCLSVPQLSCLKVYSSASCREVVAVQMTLVHRYRSKSPLVACGLLSGRGYWPALHLLNLLQEPGWCVHLQFCFFFDFFGPDFLFN